MFYRLLLGWSFSRRDIPARIPIPPIIFRIRLARAISHFSIELNEGKNEYKKILENQKKMKFPLKKIFSLKKIDIFYYFFTYLYDFINFIRLKLFP